MGCATLLAEPSVPSLLLDSFATSDLNLEVYWPAKLPSEASCHGGQVSNAIYVKRGVGLLHTATATLILSEGHFLSRCWRSRSH